MKYVRKMVVLFLCIMTIGMVACGSNGNDKMGDGIRDAADTAGEEIRDMTDTAGEEIQDMTDGMEEDGNTSQNRNKDMKKNDNHESR